MRDSAATTPSPAASSPARPAAALRVDPPAATAPARPATASARRAAPALALLAALGLAACGGGHDDHGATVSASGTTAAASGHDMSGHAMGGHGTTGGAEQMRMTRLGTATAGDQRIELDVTDPTTFSVYEGDRLVRHAPRKGENAHVMLLLSDARSGDRLPDASITLRITDERGRVVSTGPQYPMIGMGMGIHYGDNVTIPKHGRYVAQLVIGPPRIGRHADVVDRWTGTTRTTIPFTWDGPSR